MDISKDFKGYWYLPGKEDTKIPGTLKFIPGEKPELELFGSFEGRYSIFEEKKENLEKEIILGEVSNGKNITLINNHRGGSSLNFSSAFPITKYYTEYILQGIHLTNECEDVFHRITLFFPELSKWINLANSNVSMISDKKNGSNGFNISYNDKDDQFLFSFNFENEFTIEIKNHTGIQLLNENHNILVHDYYVINIIPINPKSIDSLITIANKIVSFLELSLLRRINLTKIIVSSPDVFQLINDEKKLHHPIDVYFKQEKIPENKNEKYLFHYHDITININSILKNWFSFDERVSPIINHLKKSLERKENFDSTDFLIIIQAIEGYHTRFKNPKNISLKKRLEDLYTQFKINPINIDFQKIVNSRNYYSHFYNKDEKRGIYENLELLKITNRLRGILIYCILNEIGFEVQQIKKLFDNLKNG